MLTLLVAVGSFVGFIVAYHTYGRWLATRIFALDAAAEVPSRQLRDDVDFVPTKKQVIFGHHFTSIAGTGPIVGPAIAVFWGWLPALLWVVFGSIFIGAVHDFGALVVSLRNRGQTVGEIAGRMIAPRAKILFLLILFFALTVVLAIFGLVIAQIFKLYPQSVLSVWIAMPIAVAIGLWTYRRSGSLLGPSIAALLLLYGAIYAGTEWWPIELTSDANRPFWGNPVVVWTLVLFAYCFLASVLPVWLLLQPRDYINSHQLIVALVLLVAGMAVAGANGTADLSASAPAIASQAPVGAPPIWPFLFITIACGAVSGFHGLVSSGTTSKQLDKETDGCMIGYGAMVGESLLGLAAVLATTAGFASAADWSAYYASWGAASGLAAKLAAFISGTGLFLSQLGIPRPFAEAFMSVVVVAFALTSIDSGARLLRYTFHEAGEALGIGILRNRYAATLCGVASIGFFAFFKVDGRPAGLFVWALFGTTNQILAALTLLAATVYLLRNKRPYLYTLLPMLLVITVTVWAMASNLIGYVAHGQWVLTAVGATILALALWVCGEAIVALRNLRRAAAAPVPEPEGG